MPNPHKGETEKEFVARCIPVVVDDGTAKDGKQAAAVCHSMWREHKKKTKGMMKTNVTDARGSLRTLTFRVAASSVRFETYHGSSHLVVPVVALVGDSVIRPHGSSCPEFVPASVLAAVPESWNGRPVTLDHPHGGNASANDPRTLEAVGLGSVFNTTFADNRLRMEAWIDPARAAVVGEEAERVVEVCSSSDIDQFVEVSVGAYVSLERVSGRTADGHEYGAVWRGVVSDHLALLHVGSEGACSVEMGCGAPRTASAASNKNEDEEGAEMVVKVKNALAAFVERVLGSGETVEPKPESRAAAKRGDATSDRHLRSALFSALRAVEPGFYDIVEVFPTASTVVYVTMPRDEWLWFRRGYSVSGEGEAVEVTLSDDAELVTLVTKYEPVAAAGKITSATWITPAVARAASGCGCQRGTGNGRPAQTSNENETEVHMSVKEKVKALVGQLIKCGESPFTEKDRKLLEGFGEERLKLLVDGFQSLAEETEDDVEDADADADPEKKDEDADEDADDVEGVEVKPAGGTPSPVVAKKAAAAVPKPKPKVLSTSEWLSTAPPEVRTMVARYQAQESRHRTALITVLVSAQSVYDEAALKLRPTEDLESFARMLKLDQPTPDFTGLGIPDPAPLDAPAPIQDSYNLAGLEAARRGTTPTQTKDVPN